MSIDTTAGETFWKMSAKDCGAPTGPAEERFTGPAAWALEKAPPASITATATPAISLFLPI